MGLEEPQSDESISQTMSDRGFVVTQVDSLFNCARTGSLWPMTF